VASHGRLAYASSGSEARLKEASSGDQTSLDKKAVFGFDIFSSEGAFLPELHQRLKARSSSGR
jgi:hypothetical protein